MRDKNHRYHNKMHWITAGTARRILEPYIELPGLDVWKMDLFSLCRCLDETFQSTLFILVDNIEDEREESLV